VIASTLAGQAGAARADDRSEAQTILTALEPASADDAVKQTKDALERALRMRNAGDLPHALVAEGLAREWAELARDRARTEAREKEARASQLAAIEATAHVERERALLEEAITRSGRLRAELAELTARDAKAKTKDHTSTVTQSDAPTKSSQSGQRPPSPPPTKASHGKPAHTDADAPGEPPKGPAR